MAQCAQGASEFLQDVFVPRVATLCSPDAEAVTRKNNLSFPELLRPFCRLTSEVHLRDPNNQLHVMRGLRVSVSRLETRAPAQAAARKLLSDVVSASHAADGPVGNLLSAGDYDLNISATTPWYEAYRESFMQVLPVSDHEFLRHYLACMLVVSSSHADPMDMFGRLSQDQHRVQHSGEYVQPKWLSPNTLKYYVLLHDMATGDERRAESVYESLKQLYGAQACHLLKINSRQPDRDAEEQIPDPWSQYLNRCTSLHYARLLDGGGTTLGVCSEGDDDGTGPGPIAVHDCGDGQHHQQGCDLQAHPLQQQPPSSVSQGDETGWALDDIGDAQPPHVVTDPRRALGVGGPPPLATGGGAAVGGGCGGGGGGGGPQVTGPRGLCLTLADHERIRQFVHEFTVQGLLPHVERSIRQFNDQLVSRKGLSRSLFSATKKWFGGAKTPERAVAESKNTTGLLYTAEAPELQVRKMADLCFLVQLYDLAYNCYHTAKKDFEGEQAWLYMAGALEMAALSVFLQPSAQRQYPAHYMEKAIQTYKDSCRNSALAERCTMLAVEILKSKGMFSDAASMLIRLISEDSDLRSALFLEQAAHCFINMRVPLARKFAFHMILAGHRYSKASQRKHSLRCYSQALQVYKGKGWSLAEDHINVTIGRQSFTLRQLDNSLSAFRHILINESRQTPFQQAAFLREYLYVYKHVSGVGPEEPLPQLPLPYVDSAATRLFLGHDHKPARGEMQAATHISLDQPFEREAAAQWRELEETLVQAATAGRGGAPPLASAAVAPHQQCLSAHTDNTRPPVAVLHEPITVEVCFRNPLKIPLILTDLALLWKFQARDFLSPAPADYSPIAVTNEKMPAGSDLIHTEVNPEFVLQSEESKAARLQLLPKQTGELHILGLVYSLSTLPSAIGEPKDPLLTVKGPGNGMVVRGRQDLEVQGPRLNGTLAERTTVQYGPDRRLDPLITPPMPLLQVFFINFPSALLCGEIQKTHVEFANVGPRPLLSLRVASRNPEFFTFGDGAATNTAATNTPTASATYATRPRPAGPSVTPVSPSPSPAMLPGRPVAATTAPRGIVDVPLPAGRLEPGAALRLPMWIRGPEEAGVHEVNFLFYYEGDERHPKLSHRVLRHTAVVCTARSLRLTAKASRSHRVQRDAHSLLLQLNIENLNLAESSVREFNVSQVSSVSGEWLLSPCLAPPVGKGITLGPREKMKLCFKATRCKAGSSEDAGKLMYTDVTFADEQILSWTTPCSDFFARSRRSGGGGGGGEESAAPAPSGWAPADSPAQLHQQQQQEMVVQSSRAEISLTLLWKAVVVEDKQHTVVEGQHHVWLENIGTEVTSPPLQQPVTELPPLRFVPEEPVAAPVTRPSVDALSRVVKCSLQYAQSLTHDFTVNRLCVLPITLLLSNCCPAGVEVAVDCRSRPPVGPDGLARPDVQAGYSWCGPTQRRLSLGALSSRRLLLTAAFSRPGVYNLGTARVSARLCGEGDCAAQPPTAAAGGGGGGGGAPDGSLMVRQHLPAPAFVIVEQGADQEAIE